MLHIGLLLSDRRGAHLFVIPYNNHPLAEVEGKESGHIRLASFIHDHHVELPLPRVKALRDAGQRHNPDRNRISSLTEQLSGLGLQCWHAFSSALPDALLRVGPPDERAPGVAISPKKLGEPCFPVDQRSSNFAEFCAASFNRACHISLVDSASPVEFLNNLTPAPRSCWLGRRV